MPAQLQEHKLKVVKLAQEKGIAPMTVYQRLHRGWTLERALDTPVAPQGGVRHVREVTANGITDTLTGWAARTGISRIAISMRLRAGWDPVLAVTTPKSTSWARSRAGSPKCAVAKYVVPTMGLGEARLIALGSRVGNMGRNSKLPGYAYGLDAWKCITGAKLVNVEGSVCKDCYAMKNFYKYWRPAIIARDRRQKAITHPRWVEAMTRLIDHLCIGEDRFFRWHDSGDIQSLEHLERIVEVCRRTPGVSYWMPSREYEIVAAFLDAGGKFPDNLVVRMSAHMVDQRPDYGELVQLRRLTSSTVHTGPAPVKMSRRRADSIACRAPERDNQCGRCRACWSPRVRNVSYHQH